MAKKPVKKQEVGTTGHSWDGIEELNNPLPRWWLWTFYLTIIWGIGYVIAYPAWPLINGATPGLLGYSSRAEVKADIDAFNLRNAELNDRIVNAELAGIEADPELLAYANNGGAAVFLTNCAQCHGAGANGAVGYPSLLDDDWLWGGDIEAIYTTIKHGIRNDDDPDARWSEMPAFGDFLEDEEIETLVNYVQSLSGKEVETATLEAGETLFLDNCAACHMDDGIGDPFAGAPNLTDAIWLYGGDSETLTHTISEARFGVMPEWNTRLTESQIRLVSVYVHTRGGGE